MEKIKARTAQYLYHSNLEILVFKNRIKVAQGTIKTSPEIEPLLQDPEAEFYVRYQRRHRFLKYLTGQIFIGFFMTINFGAIAVGLALLNIYLGFSGTQVLLIPFSVSFISAILGFKMAKIAHKRLEKSLARSKRS